MSYLHPAPASSGRAQLRDISDDVTVELSAGDVVRLLERDDDPELHARVGAQLERSIRRDADWRARDRSQTSAPEARNRPGAGGSR